MTLEDALREAAKRAESGVREAMNKYARGEVVDEDDLTGALVGQLDARLRGRWED